MHAARGGNEPGVQALIVAVAPIDETDANGSTAMNRAMDARDHDGRKALMHAAQSDNEHNVPIARALLLAGAKTEQPDTGDTPLVRAAGHGDSLMPRVLIQGVAMIDQRHTHNYSNALTYAIDNDGPPVRALFEGGANENQRRRDKDSTALTYAIRDPDYPGDFDDGKLPVVREKLPCSSPATLEQCDATGHMQVMNAVVREDVTVVEALAEHGALDHQNGRGQTALTLAVLLENFGMVRVLLRHGADIQRCGDGGCTALFKTTENEATMISEVLQLEAMARTLLFDFRLEHSRITVQQRGTRPGRVVVVE